MSKIVVFNGGYPPHAGARKLKGIDGLFIFNKHGQCVLEDTAFNRKLIADNHLKAWYPEEELTAEELQLNHWERYQKQQEEIERQRQREDE
jgi:hypothetical protein